MMEETFAPQTDYFPEKPIENTTEENPVGKSLFSIVLFIAAGYVFFGQNLKYTLFLVLVIFIHEMGHFIAMRSFGYKDVKMFFVPLLGAFVSGQKQEVSQKQRAITLLAGPVPGIIIGTILYAIGLQQDNQDMVWAGGIFLFLNIFNLFPISPFDGGMLIETLFFSAKETVQTIFTILSAIVLIAFAIYTESYVMLLIPFFLLMRIYQQSKSKKIKAKLDAQSVDYNKSYDELTNREYWLIRAEVIKANETAFASIDPERHTISSREQQLIGLVKALAPNKVIYDLSGLGKAFYTGVWLFFCIAPFVVLALTMIFFRPEQLEAQEAFGETDIHLQMMVDCIGLSEHLVLQQQQKLTEYCSCAIDSILKNGIRKSGMSDEDAIEYYVPYLRYCSAADGGLSVDSTIFYR